MSQPPAEERVTLARPARSGAARAGVGARVTALLVFLSAAAILAVAVYLPPDARGFGTHQQLGFGPCGMLLTTGYPCPTCGMTTAFSHTVRGQVVAALRAQASGFAFAVLTIAMLLGSLWTLVSGRVPLAALGYRLTPYRVAIALIVLFFGGWGVKIVVGLADGTLPVQRVSLWPARGS